MSARSLFHVGVLVVGSACAAHASSFTFDAVLAPEALGATGTGTATVIYDSVAQTLHVATSFSGLSGLTTVAHIHAPTAASDTGTIGVAVTPGTLPGFPAGVTSGSYNVLLDLTDTGTYTSAFFTLGGGTAAGAEAALLAAMLDRRSYLNIHTTAFPGGEIRGFLHQRVPDSGSTVALMGLSLALLGLVAGRRVALAR